MPQPLDTALSVRANDQSLIKFKARCNQMNRRYQDVLREMIDAFADDRLFIKSTNDSQKGTYYVD